MVCRQEMTGEARQKLPRHVARLIRDNQTLYMPVGCPDCSMTGYRGRFSIVEILTMNKELERIVSENATADRIEQCAQKNGMRLLWESGMQHVINGDTGVEELMRVTDIPDDPSALKEASEPRWVLWDPGDAVGGWALHLAVEDPQDGMAWAVSAVDMV